jgi:lysophospholipase L1-like esterase
MLLLDSLLAALRGWQIRSGLEFLVICLAGVFSAAVLAAAAIPAARRLIERHGGRACLLTASLLVALSVGEVFLRALLQDTLSPRFHTRQPGMQRVFRPMPGAMPGVWGESRYTINSLGIRAPEFPPRADAYRILCIGGSTTECSYLDDEETWPHLLMQRWNQSPRAPRVWVGNLGISGFATHHHLRFVQESKWLGEVDCVVLLAGVNDLTRYLRRPVGACEDADPPDRASPLWTRSRVLAVVRFVREGYLAIMAEDAAGRNYVLRRRARQQASQMEPLPDLTQALAEYRQRLYGIIRAIRRRGAVPVFLTQPTLWDGHLGPQAESLLWLGSRETPGHYVSVAGLRQGVDRYNEVLRSVCDELGVTCIDLGPMQGRVEFFYDDCHFSEAGAREVARLAAPRLTSELRLMASQRKTQEAELARAGRQDTR